MINYDMKAEMDLAADIFNQLATINSGEVGVTRDSYGSGENQAHNIIKEVGDRLGLEVEIDLVGNTYLTLPGKNRSLPKVLIGSHLDSVRCGGNFDGAAGVVSGVCVIAAMINKNITPEQDVSVMAIRAEEGCWFPETWLGSRMALGLLNSELLDSLTHVDTGESLRNRMLKEGFTPDASHEGKILKKEKIACFLEPHIEQGPVLETEGFSVGIVEAIMGGPRYREGRIVGSYAHAGGAPWGYRKDCVAALGELVVGINEYWDKLQANGIQAVVTFGIIGTDPSWHSFSRVSGEVNFCLDIRVCDEEVKKHFIEAINEIASNIEKKHKVSVSFGHDSGPEVLKMSPEIKSKFSDISRDMGIPAKSMASGAGHDAGAFIECGIPTGMLFIRNSNGSHNPDEAMEIDDFCAATKVLLSYVVNYS